MLKILFFTSLILSALSQIQLSDGLLVANSSFNNNILSISMTYNGKTPYTLTLTGQKQLRFHPAESLIEMKHSQNVQASTMFSDLTDGEYWITVKININLPQDQQLMPAKVNDQWYILPTMRFPLHILGRPQRGIKPHENMLFFEVNYIKSSLIMFGLIEGQCLFGVNNEGVVGSMEGTVQVRKQESGWIEGQNNWGQAWRTPAYFKAVRALMGESTEVQFEDGRGVSKYILTGLSLHEMSKSGSLEQYQQLIKKEQSQTEL